MNDGWGEPTRSDERHQLEDRRSGGPPCLRSLGVGAFACFAIFVLVLMEWNEVWRACVFAAFVLWSQDVACHQLGGTVERGSRWNASKIVCYEMILGLGS